MTINKFNDLDEMEQQEAIWDGIFIGDREDDEHRILLYQIDAFYVEVYLHKEYQVVGKYKAFSSTELLQPYLEKIDLLRRLNN